MIRSTFFFVLVAATTTVRAALPVAFVDNRVTSPGDGTHERPFATIAQAQQSAATVIYVAESSTPYIENVALNKGQLLIGSAFGLDPLRAEMHLDLAAPGVPAMQGPGPAMRGTISVGGDNLIAGCTMLVHGDTGIVSSGATGSLTVRDVYFKTAKFGFALFLQDHHGKVTISGGSIEASEQGSGIGLTGGDGDVAIDRFPISGDFSTAVRISDRKMGTVTFRRGSKLRVHDATDDAIVITNIERPSGVVFEDTIDVRGRRRGLIAKNVAKLMLSAGASSISTVNGAALDIRDSGVELSFESISAEGVSPGVLDEGVILNRVRGHVAVTGVEGKPGTGGTIRNARGIAIDIAQTNSVRMDNMLLADSGTNRPVKGLRCAGNFEVNSTTVCHAALYLGHVSGASFDHLVVDGGGAIGINANNIRDVTFSDVTVHHAGDETFESGVLLQEVGGTVTFNRCSFTDNAGSEMLVEQRFNSGSIVLDRCTFSAPDRPQVARQLLEVHVLGAAKLNVAVRNSEMRDSIGSGIDAAAADTSSLVLSVVDTTLQHFGHGIIAVAARQASHIVVTLHGSQFAAPAVRERAWIDVSGADNATVCVDVAANRFAAPEGTAIRLAATPLSQLRVVGVGGPDAPAITAAMAASNGGAQVVINGSVTAITDACP